MKAPVLKKPESKKRFVDEMREIYHRERNKRLDIVAEELLKEIRLAVKKAVDAEEHFVVFEMDIGDLDEPDKIPVFQRLLPLLNETGLAHDLNEALKYLIASRTEIEDITLSGWKTPAPEAQVPKEAPTAKTSEDKGYFEKLADSARKSKKKRSFK